ncbi:Pho80p cyclin, partial [Teratosphaeriaceae sp. CCFEE 6253]
PMSSTNESAPRPMAQPPAEPEPRQDPIRAPGPSQNAPPAEAAGRTEGAQPPPSEPQEARSTYGHSSLPKRPRQSPGTVKSMPRAYEFCNPKDLGVLISSMLMELIRLNDQIPLRDGRLTRFHSRAPPGISVSDYLQRLIQHATLSPPIMLSMVYYIDRLCALYPAFTINSLTVHRFLITAATVAAKGLSDSFWTNPTYARIGGIPVSELATLELEFLQKVQWKIVPKPEILEEYYRSLVERTEGFELEGGSSSGSSIDESEDGEDGDKEMVDGPT